MAREREITPNVQMEELKASSARALKRGDRVIVKPTRGLPLPGLYVGSSVHPLYGPLALVMYAGSVHTVDAVRVSRPKTRG